MSGSDDTKDFYAILGAERDTPQGEIDRLYKRLAVKHHPDRGGDEEAMKTINEAYRTLGNTAQRDMYDAERFGRKQSEKSVGVNNSETAASAADEFVPYSSPAAQADALGGRLLGAILLVVFGLVLLFLVRFHYVVFLFPLALLALGLIFAGILMSHSALTFARESLAAKSVLRNFVWAQEMIFWSIVAAGIYIVYLLLTVI